MADGETGATSAETTGATDTSTTGTAASQQVGGTSQTAAFDWKGLKLEPGLQNVVEAHGWKDVPSLLGSYTSLQKVLGVKGSNPDRIMILPKENDPPEAWNAVFQKLGRPEKPEDYGLPVPEGQAPELASTAAKWFHELGIPKGAAVKLTERWNAHLQEQMVSAQTKRDATHEQEVTALKQEWGSEYAQNTALIDKAAAAFGVDMTTLQALKSTMGPAKAMKFFQAIGSKLGVDGTFVAAENNAVQTSMAPAQARAEIERLRSDKAFVDQWNSKSDPKARQEARARMSALQQWAAPGTQTVQ